ncbi:MAG: DNA-processing protein DprA [Planctomycetaceae bacterium]|nr:DNA-processing protein DprA [Planctomycetaceae bacterium]
MVSHNAEAMRESGEAAALRRAAIVRMLSVDGIGPARIGRLLACFGRADGALDATPDSIGQALRVSARDAARMLEAMRRCQPDVELERVDACGGSMLVLGDDAFPALLRVAPDPPAALFVRGVLAAEPEPAVAIVGSRRATPYGRLHAGRIAAELAARGIVVVSGGARGIDAEAHRGALRGGGRTIAVLAAGLEHPYPPEHAPLFDAIVEAGGAVVTEQLPGVPPRAEFFPRRNRIVAGLSLATVVVEAAQRSGALVTARIAVEDLSREVGCLPGRVDSAASEGCHRAIREGWARLVTSADEIVAMLLEARTLAAGAIERMGCGLGSTERRAPQAERASAESRKRGRGGSQVAPARPASHETHHAPTRISEDAQIILDMFVRSRSDAPGNRRGGEFSRLRDGAGLDALESLLGWQVPRIAVAMLELERRGLLGRDADGTLVPTGTCR